MIEMDTLLPQSTPDPGTTISKMEADSTENWTVVSRRKNKINNNQQPGERIEKKRSTLPSKVYMATPKKKSTRSIAKQVAPSSAHIRYPIEHTGPASVILILESKYCMEKKGHNMLRIARTICHLKTGAHTLEPRGFNKAEVMFYSGREANRLLDLPALSDTGITASIPKEGLMRGVSIDMTLEELLKNCISPCKIISAKRLDRKLTDPATNEVSWVPSETVQLTFEGPVPEKIRLYRILDVKIIPYVEYQPTKV